MNRSDHSISRGNTFFRISAFILLLLVASLHSFSQTLFTYGKNKVSKDEFMRAYSRNNGDSSASKLSYDEYLELFVRFKLKVQAALDAGLDTTAAQKAELQSFRYQVAESFIREDASMDLFVSEGFERSLKDIHLSHIFVPADRNSSPELLREAEEKIKQAYARLKKGESFRKVGSSYNYGSLGYITAFVLPYSFENIAYSTRPGSYSTPFQSQSGFHIIYNDGERKAVGKLRAAQILLAYPPGAAEKEKDAVARRADSIYVALKDGADFAELAKKYSDDHHTFFNGGELPPFGVGQYDTTFEKAAFGLQNDGDITKPFETAFGVHIIKRLQRVSVIEDRNNQDWLEVIRERVQQSDRMQVAQAKLIATIRETIKNDAPANLDDSAVLEYYRNNLERYNKSFEAQLNEFKEGNLLFSIMQRKVWDAATENPAALRDFYKANKDKYNWENSADALIITCLVEDSVQTVKEQIRSNHQAWRQVVETANTLVQIDSGRFELAQIPTLHRTSFRDGLFTAPVVNEPDSSRTFAYIIRIYNGPSPKNFEDARGSVINDYQAKLEEEWVAELKQKYPVKINRRVLTAKRGL